MDDEAKKRVLKRLRRAYPEPASELNFAGEYQLVVAVILSAQCTDKKVNEVTPALFARYPGFKELARARPGALENIIRPVNYYRTKAKNLIGMARQVEAEFGGRLPRRPQELLSLPGVGAKTANVITNEAAIGHAFPVDTHVFRVAKRLGLACGTKPQQVEEELKAGFRQRYWRDLHHQLILHGRRVCTALRPLCSGCVLAELCPAAGKIKGAR